MKMSLGSMLIVLGAITMSQAHHSKDERVQSLIRAVPFAEKVQRELLMLDIKSYETKKEVGGEELPPLFLHFPELAKSIPFVSLGIFPTPILHLTTLSERLPSAQLFCKQDGLCGGFDEMGDKLFGGNKVRKLEFLLADALNQGAKTVLTFGCAGSNHAVATAAYAKKLGLDCICMLKAQHNARVVRRNLALMHHYEAQLKYYPTVGLRAVGTIATVVDHQQEQGDIPYIIPTGGSLPLGIIGFVNAAFELKQQIEAGIMPEPDYIYVAAGSLGSATGLILGCKAAGLKSRVVAVAVEPDSADYFEGGIKRLFYETNQMLHDACTTFPLFTLSDDDFIVRYTSAGQEYALFTHDAIQAMHLLKNVEQIVLDGTYSAKAFDGLLKDCDAGKLTNSVVLFWNTYCADDFTDIVQLHDYQQLPKPLHHYFVQDVQPLDKD